MESGGSIYTGRAKLTLSYLLKRLTRLLFREAIGIVTYAMGKRTPRVYTVYIVVLVLFSGNISGQARLSGCVFLSRIVDPKSGWEDSAVETYRELLIQLDQSDAYRLVLKVILDSGDPFVLPGNIQLESESLRDSLEEFMAILKDKKIQKKTLSKKLLDEIAMMLASRVKVEERSKEVEKKVSVTPTPKKYRWNTQVEPMIKFGPWNVAKDNGHFNKIYFIREDGLKTEFKFPNSKVLPTWWAVNPQTGVLYYVSNHSSDTYYRVPLFDKTGNPLKRLRPKAIRILFDTPQDGIGRIAVSPDGKWLVLKTFDNSLLKLPSGVQPNGQVKAEYIMKRYGGVFAEIYFLGSDKIYFKTKTEVEVRKLDGTEAYPRIRVKGETSFVANTDERLSVLIRKKTSGPTVEIYDTNRVIPNKQRPRPIKFDTGYARFPRFRMNLFLENRVLPLPNSHLVAEIYIRSDRTGEAQMRLIDSRDGKIVYSTQLNHDFEPKTLRVSPDQAFLLVDKSNGEREGAYSLEWPMEYLKSMEP